MRDTDNDPAKQGAARRRARLIALLLSIACPLLAGPSLGQWPNGDAVTETVHDLTHTAQVSPMSGFITNYGQPCVYCHHPHGGAGDRPLWNRPLSTASFRMYESGSLDMLIDPQPARASAICLSCHEGSVPLDRVLAKPAGFGSAGGNGENLKRCATDCHNGGNPAGGINWEDVWIEPDLRKQHPISVTYDPSRDPGFQPASFVEAAGLRLENGRVECVTCHEPHSQRNKPFLRIPNTGGSLCTACHRSAPGRSTAHFW